MYSQKSWLISCSSWKWTFIQIMSTCLLFIYYEYIYIYICLHVVRGILYHFNADAKSHVHVQLFFRWETQICLLSRGQPSKPIKPFEVQGSRSQQSWWISRPCKALRKALGPRSPDVEPVVFALEWISKDLEPAEKAKVKAPPWSSDYQWIWVGWVGYHPENLWLSKGTCPKMLI